MLNVYVRQCKNACLELDLRSVAVVKHHNLWQRGLNLPAGRICAPAVPVSTERIMSFQRIPLTQHRTVTWKTLGVALRWREHRSTCADLASMAR